MLTPTHSGHADVPHAPLCLVAPQPPKMFFSLQQAVSQPRSNGSIWKADAKRGHKGGEKEQQAEQDGVGKP